MKVTTFNEGLKSDLVCLGLCLTSRCGWNMARGPGCCCTSPLCLTSCPPSCPPSCSTSRSWQGRRPCAWQVVMVSSLTWQPGCGPCSEDCGTVARATCCRSSCLTCHGARGTSGLAEAASSPSASCRHQGTLAASSSCSASSTWPAVLVAARRM